MKNVSVIIPAYNEEKNINQKLIDHLENFLDSLGSDYEVIFVDDGSKDQTVEVLEQLIEKRNNFSLIKNSHGGKAITVMAGLLKSEGEVALFTDMDQATPIEELPKLLPAFREGFDIAIGSRSGRKGAPIVRKLSAWGFALLRNIILGLPFKDTQCGFKAFNRESIETIFPSMLLRWEKNRAKGGAVNAGFDVETLFIAKKKNLKIKEVPVEWQYVDTERVQVIRDAYEAIKDMLRIRLNDLQGRYN